MRQSDRTKTSDVMPMESDRSTPGKCARWSRRDLIAASVLAAITGILYARTFWFDFVDFDDAVFIYENPRVLGGLTPAGIWHAWTSGPEGNWTPLSWMSWMLDITLWGNRPGAMHAINVLLHMANTVLIYAVLSALTTARGRSFATALLFGVHPLHVESVAWIVERRDVLFLFWTLITILLYRHYTLLPGKLRYLATTLAFMLALLSKAMAVTVPILLLCLDYWPLERWRKDPAEKSPFRISVWLPLVLEKLPWLGLSLLSGIVTLLAQDAVRATSLNLVLTPLSKGINAVNAYAWYVAKTFLPTQLCIMYQHPRDNFRVLQFCGSAFLLALITGWVICRWRRSPYLLTGWAWFLISLLPVIGLIQAGSHAYADRYTYLPQIGLGIMLVWQTSDWLEGVRSSRRWQAAFVVIVAAAFLVLAHFQIGAWRNSSTLWHHAVTVNPEASLSQYRLALVEYESGNLSQAEHHLVRATELRHNYPEAWAALGGIYLLQKRWDLAEQASRKALDLDADNFYALKNLGSIATRKGDLPNAATLLKRAIQLDQKGSVDLRNRLGFVLGSAGDLPGALQVIESAVQLDPGNGNSQLNLGIALNHLDRAAEAVEHLLLAVQLDPKNAAAHAQLGAVLEKLHRPAEAASEYALALRLNPNDQESRKRLELLQSKSP